MAHDYRGNVGRVNVGQMIRVGVIALIQVIHFPVVYLIIIQIIDFLLNLSLKLLHEHYKIVLIQI